MKKETWIKCVIVPITGVVITGLCILLAAHIQNKPEEATVNIVDLTVTDNAFPPVLDIKIRNTGDMPAFIYKAIFYVNKNWFIETTLAIDDNSIRCYAIPVSDSYDVELPYKKTPDTTIKVISQNVMGKEVDRFEFRLGCKEMMSREMPSVDTLNPLGQTVLIMNDSELKKIREIFIFEVVIKLVYNESAISLESVPIIFTMRPPGLCSLPLSFDNLNKEQIQHNINTLKDISTLDVEKSEEVNHFINKISYLERQLREQEK